MNDQIGEEENKPTGFYGWLKDGTWKMPFKFLYIGMLVTALLFGKFMEAFFIILGGYMIREIYFMIKYG